jgi:hypothetical protein
MRLKGATLPNRAAANGSRLCGRRAVGDPSLLSASFSTLQK